MDDLHLLLRITEKLYKLLLQKFIRLDKNEGKDLSQRKNLEIFIQFLVDKCKTQNPFYFAEQLGYGKIIFVVLQAMKGCDFFFELYASKLDKETKREIPAKLNNNLFSNVIDPPYDFK